MDRGLNSSGNRFYNYCGYTPSMNQAREAETAFDPDVADLPGVTGSHLPGKRMRRAFTPQIGHFYAGGSLQSWRYRPTVGSAQCPHW